MLISPRRFAYLRVQTHRGFACGLRVELGGERNFEQDILHHIGAVWLGQAELALVFRFELLVLVGLAEQHIVETPLRCGQHAGDAHLTGHGDHRQAHSARGGISCRPGFARTGIRRVAVSAQRLAVDKGLRQRIDHLCLGTAKQVCDHGHGGDLHQYHMIQPDAVEAVLECQQALYLMCLDHRGQYVAYGQRRLAFGYIAATQVIGHGENAAEVVGRMTPFRSQPGVVEVQPADHRTDVPCGFHRVHFMRSAGDARAVAHGGTGYQRAEVLGALGETQRQQAAAQRVDQAVARGVIGFRRLDLHAAYVFCDIHQHLVGGGAVVHFYIGTHLLFLR